VYDIDNIDHQLMGALERARGRRGTCDDAHTLAVALANERRACQNILAAAIAGWALVIGWALNRLLSV
jgi:hypothetical protein